MLFVRRLGHGVLDLSRSIELNKQYMVVFRRYDVHGRVLWLHHLRRRIHQIIRPERSVARALIWRYRVADSVTLG